MNGTKPFLGNNQREYYILDSARVGSAIDQAKELSFSFDSLYRGRSEESLAVIAPYLFQYEANDLFHQFIDNHTGESWGIGVIAEAPIEALHKHFRKFLLVKDEDGRELYFRFYDPRVLRIFLPTCDTAQLKEFFGPVQYFFLEDEDPNFGLYFWLENGEFQTKRATKEEL